MMGRIKCKSCGKETHSDGAILACNACYGSLRARVSELEAEINMVRSQWHDDVKEEKRAAYENFLNILRNETSVAGDGEYVQGAIDMVEIIIADIEREMEGV